MHKENDSGSSRSGSGLDGLLIRINRLEAWLEQNQGKLHLLPLRLAGYAFLVLLMLVSNIMAVCRWPLAAIRKKRTKGADLSILQNNEAMHEPLEVDGEQLDALVQTGRPVLADFWAPWCGPCIMMEKSLEKLAQNTGDSCIVAKINTVNHAEAPKARDVKGLPTLILYRDGKEVDRHAGALSYAEMREWVNSERNKNVK